MKEFRNYLIKNLLGKPGRPSEEQECIAVRHAAKSNCYRSPRSYTWPSFVTCVIPMYQAGLLTQASALYPVFPVSQWPFGIQLLPYSGVTVRDSHSASLLSHNQAYKTCMGTLIHFSSPYRHDSYEKLWKSCTPTCDSCGTIIIVAKNQYLSIKWKFFCYNFLISVTCTTQTVLI